MNQIRSRLTGVLLCALLACPLALSGSRADDSLRARAGALAQEFLLVDAHIDLPSRLDGSHEDISVRTKGGDFDYPRARAGGLKAAFMSIYVSSSFEESGGGREVAERLITLVERLAADHPAMFALARSPFDVRKNAAAGTISLPLGMENGTPLEGKLENIRYFYDRGIRYITLVHAKNNHLCDSSYDEERRWHGLSPFGRSVVEEMNRVGMMIDVSHVSDSTFEQVVRLSRAPVIASHSSCRHFTPGYERNMSDAMIRGLAAHGGVIHITFGSMFLGNEFRKQGGKHKATVGDVVAHIDHAVKVAGVDHVGLGSDFDGVGELPQGLQDVSGYPEIIFGLLKLGYAEGDIRKICGENTLRVWSEVEQVARTMQAPRKQ